MPTRRWLATALYVVILLGSVTAATGMIERGGSAPLVMGGTLGAVVATLIASEFLFADPTRWRARRGDWLTDLCHTLVNALVPQGFGLLLNALVIVLVGLSPVVGTLWPKSAAIPAQVLIAILVGELAVYSMHRFIHSRESLWRLHRIHHGAEGLYWLNANRFHPLDLLLMNAGSLTPLVLLGAPPEVLAVWAVFSQTGSFLQHWNVEVNGSALKWLFNTPEHHRWHHSAEIHEANHNFGGALVIWDVLFGSVFLKNGSKPFALGAARVPERYRDQLLAPFRGDSTP